MIFNVDSPDWHIIYKSEMPIKADLLVNKLQSEGIEAVIVNKKDSSYTFLGYWVVYVAHSFLDQAQAIVHQFEVEDAE